MGSGRLMRVFMALWMAAVTLSFLAANHDHFAAKLIERGLLR